MNILYSGTALRCFLAIIMVFSALVVSPAAPEVSATPADPAALSVDSEYWVPYRATVRPKEKINDRFFQRGKNLVVAVVSRKFQECLKATPQSQICVGLRGDGVYSKELVDYLLKNEVFPRKEVQGQGIKIGAIFHTCEIDRLPGEPRSRVVYPKDPAGDIIIDLSCKIKSIDELKSELDKIKNTLKSEHALKQYEAKRDEAEKQCLEQEGKRQRAEGQNSDDAHCPDSSARQNAIHIFCSATAMLVFGHNLPVGEQVAICRQDRQKCFSQAVGVWKPAEVNSDTEEVISKAVAVTTGEDAGALPTAAEEAPNRQDEFGRQGRWREDCNDYGCSEGEYRDGKPVGQWKEVCTRYGCSEGEYRDGKRVGRWKIYCTEYGCTEGEYRDGMKVGKWKEVCTKYGCDEGEYRDGNRVGRWKEYCTKYGCSEGEFREGKKAGQWKEDCTEYGCSEGEYRDGHRVGQWKECDESGCRIVDRGP